MIMQKGFSENEIKKNKSELLEPSELLEILELLEPAVFHILFILLFIARYPLNDTESKS